MISSGVISLTMGMLPAMKITEPYSPSARAKASAKPVSRAGARVGRMTRRKVWPRLAPRVAAASSSSLCRSSSTGCTVRTTKGRPMKVRATNTPSGVNATLTGSHWPIQPFSAYSAVSAMPATAVGRAKGRSTSASTTRWKGKR